MTLVIWSFYIYYNTNCSVYYLNLNIPEEFFFETTVGCTASYFVKIIWRSDTPIFRQCIASFAVAEGWLLLHIGWFVLFLFLLSRKNDFLCLIGILVHKLV